MIDSVKESFQVAVYYPSVSRSNRSLCMTNGMVGTASGTESITVVMEVFVPVVLATCELVLQAGRLVLLQLP